MTPRIVGLTLLLVTADTALSGVVQQVQRPVPAAGASVDERTQDLLLACGAEFRVWYSWRIDTDFRFSQGSTGSTAGDAYANVLGVAQHWAQTTREDAAETWRVFQSPYPDPDRPPTGAGLRCLAKRRLEQIDGRALAEPRAPAVLDEILTEVIAAPSSGAAGRAQVAAALSLPPPGADLDVRAQDLLRACAPQVARYFAALVITELPRGDVPVSNVGPLARWLILGRAQTDADEDRTAAAKTWAVYLNLEPHDPPERAHSRCMAKRRLEQIDRGPVPETREPRVPSLLDVVLVAAAGPVGRGSGPAASALSPVLVQIPLAQATPDMVAEDLLRSCPLELHAYYTDLVKSGFRFEDSTRGTPADARRAILLELWSTSGMDRAGAEGRYRAFSASPMADAVRCVAKRRIDQFGGAALKIGGA